jgi:hypothetical protein
MICTEVERRGLGVFGPRSSASAGGTKVPIISSAARIALASLRTCRRAIELI